MLVAIANCRWLAVCRTVFHWCCTCQRAEIEKLQNFRRHPKTVPNLSITYDRAINVSSSIVSATWYALARTPATNCYWVSCTRNSKWQPENNLAASIMTAIKLQLFGMFIIKVKQMTPTFIGFLIVFEKRSNFIKFSLSKSLWGRQETRSNLCEKCLEEQQRTC